VNNPISSILKSKPCVILDGAMATELEARGCDLHDPLWSAKVLLETPDLIRDVHADYFAAGADCAITASYQATFQGFAQRGLSTDQSADLMRLSVSLACEARDAFWASSHGSNSNARVKPFVAASVGPYGAFLADGSEYRGDYGLSLTDLMDFHRPRMAVLANSGADMLACETIPCLLEAQALLKLLEEFPKMTAWFSFSARDGTHTNHGELISDCARSLEHPQVAAMGVNCTAPEFVTDLTSNARGATTKPILAYPNSGEVYDATQKRWTGESSCSSFATQARAWFTAGARVIGGCCRTSPEHIRELSTVIDLSVNVTQSIV
jgi:homocysteine S-methyltransferase